MDINNQFRNIGLRPMIDGAYFAEMLAIIERSQKRCLCSIFIVDHNLRNDERQLVDQLLLALSAATWRGVDVRLIVGGSRTNRRILETVLMAWERAKDLNIDTRLAAASEDYNTHVKLVVADQSVVNGSHNWSGSLTGAQTQDSIVVESPALAAYLSRYFDEQWANTLETGYHV